MEYNVDKLCVIKLQM